MTIFLVYHLPNRANLVCQSKTQNNLHAKADNKNSRLADLGQNDEVRTTKKKARSSRHGHNSGELQTGDPDISMSHPMEDSPIEESLPLHRWLEESKACEPFYGIVVGGSNHTVTQDNLDANHYSESVKAEAGSEIDVY